MDASDLLAEASSSLYFGQFTLEPRRAMLARAGVPVALRPKSFALLCFFAAHPGRVLAKEELLAAVWPGVVVTDDSLSQCVNELRAALADRDQHLIKTVPRRGYRFDTHVSGTPLAAAALPVPPAPPETALRTQRNQRFIGIGAALASVLLGATLIALRPSGPERATAAAPPLSIAVLPLVNRGDDPDQAWFADGLTEDLTTDLTRIPDSFVIARSSADTYKGKAVDVRQIGRELGVRYVLEGSVQRMGNQVRLNLRLIDAEQGQELWSDRLDGSRSELAALQSQVTGIVANALHKRMIDAESQRSQRLRPVNPDAQDLAWQAFSAFERRTPDKTAAARELAQRAVALDPTSTLGWSVLGLSYSADVMARWVNLRGATRDEWVRRAAEADAKAYAIDPNNLYAVQLRAEVLGIQGKPEESLVLRQRAVAINRNAGPAWGGLSYAYATLGMPEESIAAGLEAIRLSPRDGRLHGFLVVIAAAHLYAGRDAEALAWAQRAINARPEYSIPHAWAAAAAANLGDLATARAEIAEFRRLQPDYSLASFKAERYSDKPEFLRQRERFYQGLHKAGLAD